MGVASRITLFYGFVSCFLGIVITAEDVENFKDPYLIEIASYAANNLLKAANELGLNNQSSLNRIMDAQVVTNTQPTPTQYMLTLELGVNCSSDGICQGDRYICELTVLDEAWAKKRSIDDTKCAEREPNGPLEFIDTASTIATSLPIDGAATKTLAANAVSQMGERRGGKHTLIHMGQVRKVMMEESNSNLYYLTLYISTTNDNAINEVCEVTMEEALSTSQQTLQSLRCFTTGDNEGADKYGIARVPSEELTSDLIRHAVLASLAIIDVESTSAFQLKIIGYSLVDARVSVDSGARDLQMKLGLVPTLCIKQAESSDDDDDDKACTIDNERDPSMCSITLTQWPWVTDGYLFSDFDCEPTTYAIISEELEAYTDEDSSASSAEEDSEVEEVTSNAVQNGNRRQNVETPVEEKESEHLEGREVIEEPFVARTGPCLGCPTDLDVNSPNVKEMADFVLLALENAANSDRVQSVARIVKATSQVVSGISYALTIELVDTECLRSENFERSKCKPDPANGNFRTCTVNIWDQPWLNSKQIRDPDCEDASGSEVESRSLKTTSALGPRENMTLSPEDDDVKIAANFALSRLDAFDDNSKKRILIKIIEAASHSVARSKTYNIRIQVALTECPESDDANSPTCQSSLVRSVAYICDVQVLAQAGSDRSFVPKRLVDSKCFPLAPELAEKDQLSESSGHKKVSEQQLILPGGVSSTDTASPYIQSVAQFATSTINQRSNDARELQLVRILRADTQVVAGKKIMLDVEVGFTNCTKSDVAQKADGGCHLGGSDSHILCRVTIWDRAWLNDRQVTNLTCDDAALLPSSTGAEVEAVEQAADSMSNDIEVYADFALAVIEDQSNADDRLKVAKILASSIQVADGKNVRLTLEIAATSCRKGQPMDDSCPIDEEKQRQVCNIHILDRQQEKQVTDLNCQLKRRASRSEDFDESPFAGEAPASFRLGGPVFLPEAKSARSNDDHNERQQSLPVLGGYETVDPSDSSVIEIANFAALAISQSFNSAPSVDQSTKPGNYMVAKIHSAAKQIVAGINYKLELELSRPDGSLLCRVVVFDQSWTSTRKVTDMTCFPQAFTDSANSSVGAASSSQQTSTFRPMDLSDAAVQSAASFATEELGKSSSPISLIRINSAARQVAADQSVTYKLTLQLKQSEATLICNVVVSEPVGGRRKLSSSSCGGPSNKRRRQLQLGGYSPADPNDHTIKEMASFAASAITEATNEGPFKLAKITSASKQIVSGVNYKLTIEMDVADAKQSCNVIVYDQSWTKTRKLTSFECKDPQSGISRKSRQRISTKSRRPIVRPNTSELSVLPPQHCSPGGYCPVDPNEKAVQEMASFATTSLSRLTNAGPLTLVKVRSAARQVVAGFNYQLELEFNGANGPLVCNVTVFDQAWTSTREISKSECPTPAVKAESADSATATGRPSLVRITPVRGAYRPRDPQEAEIQEIAAFATSAISLAENGPTSQPFKLLEIVSAASQVVSGTNYRLNIRLSAAEDSLSCEAVIYDQSWTSTRKLSSFKCTPEADLPTVTESVATKEPVVAVEPVTSSPPSDADTDSEEPETDSKLEQTNAPEEGAYLPIDLEEEEVTDLAQFATRMLGLTMDTTELTLLKINSATKQTVGGFNYQLGLEVLNDKGVTMNCDVVVYDHPTARQMTFSSCAPISSRVKRSDPTRTMTGGVTLMDLQGPKVKELSDFALSAITLKSNEPTAPDAVHVVKATQQVVSGVMYTLELELVYSNCPLEKDESCIRRQRCTVSVWEQAWLSNRKINQLACKDTKTMLKKSRNNLGARTFVDPNSEEIKTEAAFALKAVQAQSNSPSRLAIVRIKSAATQTVSGKKIFLTLEIGQTDCKINNKNAGEQCTVDMKADHQTCKVAIWVRPWLNERQVVDLKCADLSPAKLSRISRSVSTETPLEEGSSTALPVHHHIHHHHNHHHHKTNSKNVKKTRRLKHMNAFRAYATKFNKVYTTWTEFETRYKIYRANQEKIELLNKYEMGTAVYGDTPFSDYSAEEYKQHLAGMRPHLRHSSGQRLTKAMIPQVDLPKEYDWRNFNVVTPVKNQGQCGSCWAFSVTGNVEGVYGVKYNTLISLSEQELVDCDKLDSGCNGGLPENAYKAITELGGLELEADYPYNGHENKCKLNPNITQVQVTGGVEISTNETEMAQWLVENGPISIGINANGMQFYRGGVSHPWKVLCRAGGIDHGVLIVGYGVAEYPKFNKTMPYWIVKNSWGTSWGEQGYYRVFRGDGTCGLNQMATSAVVA